MPTYEYRCETCGETFEQRESISEHEAAEPRYPKCGSEKVGIHGVKAMADLSVAAIERSVCASYQPIVEIDGERVVGCEALARWRREDGALASIEPVATAIEQDENLATALTAQMLKCVDRDLLDLLIRKPSFYVSINLPPVTLGHERLRQVVEGLGLAQRLPQLVGEITERQALDDLGRAAIREIRRVGAKIALDDFGTGNSGL